MKCAWSAAVVLLGCSVATGKPADGNSAGLMKEIARLEARYGGHIGLMAKNLNTGESVGYNASERFPTASAIKLPILSAFFDQVDRKAIDPGATITLTREDRKPGSGILQLLSEGDRITLLDAVKLMITLSDNTATNLVLDRLAPTHAQRLALVNDFLVQKGLKNTRLLNRLFSFDTKMRTPEALRYGIGVSTAEDMVALLEALYSKTLVSPSSCEAMLGILGNQHYREMIPRFLPEGEVRHLQVANKTGSVNETKVDIALILSEKANIALAIFVDKHPDHRGDIENQGILLGAMAARAVWNYFTGGSGYQERSIPLNDVDWNTFPGGRWGIYRSSSAPYPHKKRAHGFRLSGGNRFPYHPHYDDNSIVVVVPETFKETADGTNVIVHFHGSMDDNMSSLEKHEMPQALIAQEINAILVMPQGPYRAQDSFWGKMEDTGGLRRLIEDLLSTMKSEQVLQTTRLNQLIVSAEGSALGAAAAALKRGGMADKIPDIFLFDASFRDQDAFGNWLARGNGVLHACFTSTLAREYASFERTAAGDVKARLRFAAAAVEHDRVIRSCFQSWLGELGADWKNARKQDRAPAR